MKPSTYVDWKSMPRGGSGKSIAEAATDEFIQVEKFVRNNGGFLVSCIGEKGYRFEVHYGSTLHAKLIELGWNVRHLGSSIRTAVNEPLAVYELKPQ